MGISHLPLKRIMTVGPISHKGGSGGGRGGAGGPAGGEGGEGGKGGGDGGGGEEMAQRQ